MNVNKDGKFQYNHGAWTKVIGELVTGAYVTKR